MPWVVSSLQNIKTTSISGSLLISLKFDKLLILYQNDRPVNLLLPSGLRMSDFLPPSLLFSLCLKGEERSWLTGFDPRRTIGSRSNGKECAKRVELLAPEKVITWDPRNLSFCYIYGTGQFTPKMKANAEPRLLSSLVWIDSGVVVSQHHLKSFFMK